VNENLNTRYLSAVHTPCSFTVNKTAKLGHNNSSKRF